MPFFLTYAQNNVELIWIDMIYGVVARWPQNASGTRMLCVQPV
jgi:hypothetical protein